MLLRKLDALWATRVQPMGWWFESDLLFGVLDKAYERWSGVRAALQVMSWKAPSPCAPLLSVALSRFYQPVPRQISSILNSPAAILSRVFKV